MKKRLLTLMIFFPFLAIGAGKKIALSINNYSLLNLGLSVSNVKCMYDTDNFNKRSIASFDSYSNVVQESKKAGACFLASTKHKFTLDANSDSDHIGRLSYYRKATNGNYCSGFSAKSYLTKDYRVMIAPGCNNSSPSINMIIGYIISAQVNNYLIQQIDPISKTPNNSSEYLSSPPSVGAGSSNAPGTGHFSFSPTNSTDAQNVAVIEYGPSKENYCKFTYGYQSGQCYASENAINDGDDYVSCNATATPGDNNSCQITLEVKPGLIPLKFSEPKTINVNIKNKIYTNLQLKTFAPTDASSYVNDKLPPSAIASGSSLTPAFQFNEKAASDKQPTIAYTVQEPNGSTCSFNYGWDDTKKMCYVDASGSGENILCSGVAEPRTNSTECTVDLNVSYANPPTVSVNVKNNATDSSDSLNLKDYQPTDSSDYTGNPPPDTIAPKGTGAFTYNVQNDASIQPYVEYDYSKSSDAYCKFSYNAIGTNGCTATADPVNNDPLYEVSCNETHSVKNGMCVVNFSMNVGPLKPPTQFNVTINNNIYDDLENSAGDNDAPNSIENGESSATYQENINDSNGSPVEKTVTYQMKNFSAAACTFTYGWNDTQSCYAKGVASAGPPLVECGKVTATRDKDSCDINLTFGTPNSNNDNKASDSKSLLLRYAKPPVYGSGAVPSVCPSTTQNVTFVENTPEEAIMCVASQAITIAPSPLNEVTHTVPADWRVYDGPPNRLYDSSAENLNTAVITPPYDADDNIVTYTYNLMTGGTKTFQYQMLNEANLTASYNGNAYVLQDCQDDATDPAGGHIVCGFQYTPSLK